MVSDGVVPLWLFPCVAHHDEMIGKSEMQRVHAQDRNVRALGLNTHTAQQHLQLGKTPCKTVPHRTQTRSRAWPFLRRRFRGVARFPIQALR